MHCTSAAGHGKNDYHKKASILNTFSFVLNVLYIINPNHAIGFFEWIYFAMITGIISPKPDG